MYFKFVPDVYLKFVPDVYFEFVPDTYLKACAGCVFYKFVPDVYLKKKKIFSTGSVKIVTGTLNFHTGSI